MAVHDHDFALVIGVRHYPDYRHLDGAINDAEEFHNWLCDSAGGGLHPENAQLVTSRTDPMLLPVQELIDEALQKIAKRSAVGGRRFYFYFAGHGMGQDTTELSLCLPRWSPQWRRAALCLNGYVKFAVELGHYRQVVCFLDCCRARQLSVGCNPPQVQNVKPAETAGQVETFLAFATEFDNLAYEAEEKPGGPVRGHFTRALLEGLRGAAAGPFLGVQPQRLANYVVWRTTELAKDHQQDQTAYIPLVPRNEEDWVFGTAEPAYNVRIEFLPGHTGPMVLEGPRGEEITRGSPNDGSWSVKLDAAWHVVRDEGGRTERPFRVRPNGDVQVERF